MTRQHGITTLKSFAMCIVAVSTTAAVLWAGKRLSTQAHAWIMGAGAVLFAISETFFARLLTEATNLVRFAGYSVWQISRLRQLITPLKARTWRLWTLSQFLKAVTGLCAVLLLQKQATTARQIQIETWLGYTCIFLALLLSIWAWRNFSRIERFRENLTEEEIATKERNRLKLELGTGQDHDFTKDQQIRNYTRPPDPP